MSDRRNIGLIIDESFESLMTVVYNFYYEKTLPKEIIGESGFQQSLGIAYDTVVTDSEKAEKVISSMQKKFTHDTLENIYYAYLSNGENKYMLVFAYTVAAFKLGKGIDNYKQIDYVLAVQKMAYYTRGEAHQLKGLLRFSETQKGFFYADISPNCNVLPLLAEHFSDRLCDEKFIIHDVRRNTAVLYNGSEWVISDVDGEVNFEYSEFEDKFRMLWTTFYHTIGIKERKNAKLRRSNMPKRYWKHLTEFKTNLH